MQPFTDICFDSRRVTDGALFIAVPSVGEAYANNARARGAAAVMRFTDETQAREVLAHFSSKMFGEPQNSLTLIGVTGTNGKTTVTTLTKQVYERVTGKKAALIGTVSNLIGDEEIPSANTTPESRDLYELLAKARAAGCEAVFMEVSSHALEIRRVEGLRFAVGVLTNLTQDHIDFHKTMETYLAAKLRLFEVSDICICDRRVAEKYTVPQKAIQYDGADNYEAVRLICKSLNLDSAQCEAALDKVSPPKGRMEIVDTPGLKATVIIDYAHTPDGLEHVLTEARQRFSGCPRLTVLFGCGGDRDKTKRPVMGEIASRLADRVIVTSDNPRTEPPGAIIADIIGNRDFSAVIENRIEAIEYVLSAAIPGEVIILAGKGHEDYQIIGKEKIHLDEREIIRRFLDK
ncbi:MAG: UDP-N-acetylmuramoyl-L-alanyl-D-glutamate--2,6-diaminopimelate ligase [Oscillospiraceae bacterium]|jgi:UDP-N-acetylmuramoyl-L-alanyl-D-glutamate--2,6-diaminopimelate ligase|nr:UDP-N-acetylmuramoyl-L-alanyl-D-glutamate--2,6-diaminopimelate ligase [Oscillospiraceae bacterium]